MKKRNNRKVTLYYDDKGHPTWALGATDIIIRKTDANGRLISETFAYSVLPRFLRRFCARLGRSVIYGYA